MAKQKSKASKKLTKSGLIQAIVDSIGESASRKDVKAVIETLTEIGHKELKKNGVFLLPGFAKFVVVKKPARPARKGINPFTKQAEKKRTKISLKKKTFQVRNITEGPFGNTEIKKTYALSSDGKTLTMEILNDMGFSQTLQKIVYNKE